MLAAVGLVAISLAGLWLLGRVRLKTISLASGMAIVGLIWWLLLNPSPVGLAIATAGGMWRARRWLEKEKDGADLD